MPKDGGARVRVTSPGDDSTGQGVPVSGLLFNFLRHCSLDRAKFFLDNSPSGFVRPQYVRQEFRGVLSTYKLRGEGFRILERAFTAHYIRTGVSVGALDRVLKRSSIAVAVGQCIRPSLRLGQRAVRRLTSFVSIGWTIGPGYRAGCHYFFTVVTR